MKMTKWRTLVLATAAFNLSFLIWFSFAPFTGPIAEEFGLSLTDLGILASAAIWSAPPGRILTGWLSDRFGASSVFAIVLAYVGVFSMASAFATSYEIFFVERLVVASAGITFVVGIQHVAQWFPEEQLGTAEGVYAGIGNAGAAGGALVLPRVFGQWNGPLFDVGWRAAFFYTGVVAILMAIVYYTIGQDAATETQAEATSDSATLSSWVHVATRYGVIALALGYVMSFGLEISMNGWLPTYFREGFGSNLVIASTFAATFSLAAGLLRPIGGYMSDWVVRTETDILPVFTGRYREQWTVLCMGFIVTAMAGLTFAGQTGNVLLTVAVGFLVGTACAFTEGAIFAQVPAMFPDRSGAAAGVVGGIGTFGGIGFPLVYSYAAETGAIHSGYIIVAAIMVPIVLLNAWVARPKIAEFAHVRGIVGSNTADYGGSDG
ncbi:MFS transporter, NNP family, nitrate/nitrite transporter [Halogranum gelatinilyticum]|uniref:MFS transporter, NNP family, nitrate/nitrite transporter n=2 Tax=Halogranum gelatinilyticum TaxID=660521 RepID=A0A1G9XTQ8_9EURY|nr:MFS transporter, NNP family, nitrate/nitrite transporter [Halogranum gelatinilyticum]